MNDAELLRFIKETEEHYFVEAPKNFKENILIQTSMLPAKTAYEAKKLSKNMQLFFYSMKVCTAVLAVLLFLNFSHTVNMMQGSVTGIPNESRKNIKITSVIAEKTTDISGTLKILSDELLNLGGIFDD